MGLAFSKVWARLSLRKQEMRILNKLLTWKKNDDGEDVIEIEANPRHVEITLKQLRLEGDGVKVKSVTYFAWSQGEGVGDRRG